MGYSIGKIGVIDRNDNVKKMHHQIPQNDLNTLGTGDADLRFYRVL
jgi:hypothetical protein